MLRTGRERARWLKMQAVAQPAEEWLNPGATLELTFSQGCRSYLEAVARGEYCAAPMAWGIFSMISVLHHHGWG